ncbi:uncharacterized protein LOC135488792 isoform X2 [Lineus longissimus]|uniref:uncharacterized protein LOC135488792 isoform X2 n=1 Tax=Lineus longissimus TaxID=88925 RepID=UPI00315C5398
MAVRLSLRHFGLIFFIWIFTVTVSLSKTEQCYYNKSCKNSAKVIQILKATNASDWENCNMKPKCDNQNQNGSFDCKCVLKSQDSYMDICGKSGSEGSVGSKDFYIFNANYPETNSQPDICECAVRFNSSGSIPDVWFHHIDLPPGASVYVTADDLALDHVDRNNCSDLINCRLPVEQQFKRNGLLRVISTAQQKAGKLWIKVSSAKKGFTVNCSIKRNGVTAKTTTLVTTPKPKNTFTSEVTAKTTTLVTTPKPKNTPTSEISVGPTGEPTTTVQPGIGCEVIIACAAVAGIVGMVIMFVFGVWWHKMAKGFAQAEIMQDNCIHESTPTKENEGIEDKTVGFPMKENDIYESSGSLDWNKTPEYPMKDNDIYQSSGLTIGDKTVGYPMKDNDIYQLSGLTIGDKTVGYPMKENDIYQSSGLTIGDKTVGYPMKDNDIYQLSGLNIGDKTVGYPMKDNDIYQSSGSTIAGKNVWYPMKDSDIYQSAERYRSHEYPMGIMKENDIYQSSDLHPRIDQAFGAPTKVTSIYELEGHPKDKASGCPLYDDLNELDEGSRDVRAGHGYPLGENAYELGGDPWFNDYATVCPMTVNVFYEPSNPHQTDHDCMKDNDIIQWADQTGVKTTEGHKKDNQLCQSFDLMQGNQDSVDERAPREQLNSVDERAPREQLNSVDERAQREQLNSVDERAPREQLNSVDEGAPREQLNSVEERAPREQLNSVDERAPREQLNSVDERAPREQLNSVDERAPREQLNSVDERAPREQLNSVDERAPREQLNSVDEGAPREQLNSVEERAPREQLNSVDERAPREQLNSVDERAPREQLNSVDERAPREQMNSVEERAPREQLNSVEERAPREQLKSVDERAPREQLTTTL